MKKIYLLLLVLVCLIITATTYAQISVTATAGTVGPTTYTTLNGAITAINAGTHQGVINVSVTASTTEIATSILASSGTGGASYTAITIKPATGVTATIGGSIATNAILKLNGADNITIDGSNVSGGTTKNLTFNNTSSTATAVGIWIAAAAAANGATNNTIKNCIITGANVTTSIYGIFSGNTTFGTTAPAAANSNNTVQNNQISTFQNGIFIVGNTTSPYDQNWNITGNTISTIGFRGVRVSSSSNLSISSNLIQNLTVSGSAAGGIILLATIPSYSITQNILNNIVSSGGTSGVSSVSGINVGTTVTGGTISRNTLTGIVNSSAGGWGARGIILNTGNGTSATTVSNNIIADIYSYSDAGLQYWPIGISVDGSTGGVNLYYNSIHLYGDHPGLTSATGAACIYINTSGSNLDIRNNALVNSYNNSTSSSDKAYTIYSSGTSAAYSNINYNDYYVSGVAGVMGYISGDRTNLAGMIAGFGGNAQSISVMPTFVSSTDLHLSLVTANVPLQTGTTIGAVTTDIDGATRGTPPIIGADEVLVCSGTPATGSISATVTTACSSLSSTLNLPSVLPAIGLTYQWQNSSDGGTYSDIGGATTSSYAASISSTTYYKATVGCSLSSLSATTAAQQLTVVSPPAAISGTLSACQGATSSLTDATGGGVWATGDAAVATVNSSGVVTGVASGTATISYTVSGCSATAVFTVSSNPGSFSGTQVVCAGSATTLTNSGGPGTWTSTNTSVATAASGTGVVTGVAAGTALISYANGCGTPATTVVTVNALPGSISGTASACVGSTVTLTNSISGGTWSSSTPAVATADASSGVITGVAAGTTTITYNLGNGCSMATRTQTINANPAAISFTPATTATICFGSGTSFTASTVLTVNILNQNFNSGLSGSVGGAWTVLNTGTTSTYNWAIVSPNQYTDFLIGGDGSSFMETDANLAGSSATLVTQLRSPSFSTVGYESATLSFNYYCFSSSSYDLNAQIDYSTDGGATWNLLYDYYNTTSGAATWSAATPTQSITLPAPALGQANVMLRWYYNSNWGFYWAVDNIKVNAAYATTYSWSGISGASGLSCTTCTTPTITPTATGANIYSVTATANGCSTTGGVTVSVNPTPAAIAGALNVCAGGTSSLTSATGGGVWSSSDPAIATVNASGFVTAGATIGTTTISYTASGCSATATFAVNAAPGPITGTTSLCTGVPSTLANSGGAGTWTSTNTSVATVGSTTGIVTGVSAGTAVISYVNGCATYVSTTVTVIQSPAAITGSATVCMASTATLASSTTGGTWSSSNPAIATVSSSDGVVTAVSPGTTTISYTLGNGCPDATRTQSVNTAPPSISISPATSATICYGSSSAFTASTPTTVNVLNQNFNSGMTGTTGGTWTVVNTGDASIYNWAIVAPGAYTDFVISGDGTNFVETDANLAGSSATLITELRSPAFSTIGYSAAALTFNYYILSDASYDFNAEIDYSTDGGSTWNVLHDYFNTTSGTATWAASTPTQTINLPAGLLNQSNVMLRWYYNSNWGYYWAVDNIKLTGTYPTPAFTWAGISGAAGLSCTSCAAMTVTPTAIGANTYSVTATANGCSTTSGVTVDVNALPAAITGGMILCAGGTTTLSNTTGGGTWTSANTAVATASSSTGEITGVAAGTAMITYTVTATGCYATAVVTVQALPSAAPTNTSPICNSGTVTFAANPMGGATLYTWSGANLSSTTAANPTATPTVTGVYSLTVSNGTGNPGCAPATVYTTSVTVNATPTAVPTNSGPICNGGTVTMTANPAGGASTYSWSGPALSSATVANPTATPTVTSTYSLTVTNGTAASGCSPTTVYTTTVTVNSAPTAAPTNNGYICNGGTVTLTANPGGSASAYTWSGPGLSATTAQNPTATPTVTSTYSLMVTNGTTASGCVPATVYTTAVTVNAIPTAAPTNSSPICNGGTVTLTANPASGANTYSWAGPNLASSVIANPTATPTVTATYSLTVTDGSSQPGCSPATVYTTSVTVNTTPTAAPTNSGPICNGGTATLTANPAGGATVYSWSGPSLSSATDANPTATPTVTSTYSLTVTNGTAASGCAPTTIYTTTVTVNGTPTAAPTNNGYICNGGTVTLTANPAAGASTYAWSGPGLSSATAQNPTATPTVTSTYSLMVTNGTTASGCSPATVYTTSVTVNSTPTASPTNNGYICNGGTVALTANPAGGVNTYTWSGSSLSATNVANPTATPTATATYSLTVSDGSSQPGCTTSGFTTTVTVNPTPAAAPTNSSPICNGGTVTLTANPAGGATTYSWSGAALSSGIVANPTATPTVTGTYSLTVSDGSTQPGCAPTTVYTTSVTVNSIPTAAPTNNGYICNGGTVTLSANPATGANTYAWSGPGLSSATAQNPTATPTVTSTYSLTVTNGTAASGCSPSTVYTTTVTVNSTPTASPANNGYICNGGTVTLTANPAGGANTYTWSGSSLSATNVANPAATPTTTATYSLTVSDGSSQPGCTTSGFTTTVTVNPTPAAAPTNSSPICNGGTVTLTANPAGGATTYSWSGAALSSGIVANPTATPTVTGTYSLTVSDGSTQPGCAPTTVYTTSVTVNSIPTAAPTNNGYICNGGTVTLSANPATGANTYAWSGPGLSSATAQNPTATPTVTSTYSLTVTNGTAASGCSPSTVYTTTVTVNSTPTASPANNGYICNGGTVALTANPAGGANTYTWSGSSLSATNVANPTATPTATATYSLTVSDGSSQPGCTTSGYTTLVTVNATPTAAPSNNGYICLGGTVILAANAAGGANTYVWSGADLAATTIANPTAVPTVTGTYSLTVSDGSTQPGCAPATVYTTTVTVNAIPVASPANSSPLCAGGTVTLTANPGGGATSYAWSGAALSSATAQNPTATPTVTGVYSLTVSDGSSNPGCSPSTVYTTSVTVNAAPTLANVTNNGPICVGATLNLSANTPSNVTGYSWSGPVAVTGATTATPSVPAATTAATGIYTVVVNNNTGSGCTATYTTSATVNTLPTIAAITPSTTNMCVGTPLTLTAGTANGSGTLTSYNWSGPNSYNTTTSSGSATFTPGTTATSGVYTLSVTYTGGGCVSDPVTSGTVTVNNLPTVTSISVSPSVLCANNPITLTGAGASGSGSLVSYNWTGPNSYSSTTAASVQTYTVPSASASGVYSLSVTYTGTGCTSAQAASNTLTVNALPAVYNITGGGFYCSGGTGVHVGLNGSEGGVNYQLYNGATAVGSPVAGTGSAIDFGLQTAGGTYSVSATNATTGCGNNMTGTTSVAVGSVPTVYAVTGGGNYCAGGTGVHVGLASSDLTVGYQLYRGSTAIGSIAAGTGSPLDFGLFTTAGTYTVVANPSATCAANMTGSATVGINPVPNAYNITGGGNYCAGGTGVHIGLDWSIAGISYQLYNGATAVGTPVSGSTSGLDFGLITSAGTYSVLATNAATTCTNSMTGTATVVVNALPVAYTVTGTGNYCAGGAGVAVGISNSESGVNYQLYNGVTTVGTAVAGTGSAISFGMKPAGSYSVIATNASTLCTNNMTGTAVVTMNTVPAVYTVTGGGSYCAGASGVHVGLTYSDIGINYQLYNGATPVGIALSGASSGLDFGFQTAAGTYTIVATNPSTTCASNMSGNATITVNAVPATFTVTGGGTACGGSAGVSVGLSGSASGINYQLYNGAATSGTPVAGTGAALDLGMQATGGTYTVLATNATTACTSNMTGSAVVNINPAPTAYTVTGGGSYCSGGAGYNVGLSNSTAGVTYQLYNGATAVGSLLAGTGAALSFGTYTAAGTYTVLATNITTLCTAGMTGNAVIAINPMPTVYTVTGGGSYCSGGSGVAVGLSNSDNNVNYQLYNGSTATGTPVAGTGASISFGAQTSAGTYTVFATSTASCTMNMTGSAAVSVNALPVVYTVTGGGAYCAGGAGSAIGLSNSETGISYQLYQGATASGSPVAGTGAAISFGFRTAAGSYSVAAVNSSTSCSSNMTGTATVSVNAIPAAYSVTGGGNFCAGGTGVTVGLASSNTGINYQLYNGPSTVGTAVAGTGSPLNFGLQTTAGTYTVLATDGTNACTSSMIGGANVIVNPLPTVYGMTGGGSYCSGGTGVHVGLTFSNSGVNYQLYNGSTAVGSTVAGANAAIDFGLITTAGTYTVYATNATTSCANNMSGNSVVVVNPLPTAYAVTGGGNYCAGGSGVAVGLGNSESGVNYQLYNGSGATGSAVAGTSAAISFGMQTSAGTYTVFATNASTACTNNMSGSVTIGIDPLPTAYTVTGGGTYCSGGSGYNVGLSSSVVGTNYQLYNGAATVGTPVAGTGSAISFGVQNTAGTYSVLATNLSTSCTNAMTGSATIVVNPLPTVFTVTGGGNYCAGGTGLTIGLSGSGAGINYQLYRGSTAVGSPVAGTGAAIAFGLQTAAGTYSVSAVNTTTSCTNSMSGTATIGVNPLPNVFNVTGGGSYCSGSAGVHVGLSYSTPGINYQLYLGSSAVGSPLAGNGAGLDFGFISTAGTYTVFATNTSTSCTSSMAGSAVVSINALPAVYAVTGGGSYCADGSGIAVGLGGSSSGISYQLYNGTSTAGSAVAGTGSALSFGIQSAAGTYSVRATNSSSSCTSAMTGTAVISVNALPTAYTVSGGGSYCQGGFGVNVSLEGSTPGVNYQLYNGTTAAGTPVAGTGSSIDFGLQTAAGTYSVFATNATTSCTRSMTGTTTVVINPLPTAYTVTGGGNYCSGGSGVAIGLSNSASGVAYQLYRGSTAVGSPVSGTGAAITFGTFTTAGTYSVAAANSATFCASNMAGSATISINAMPAVYAVTGGGSYCPGGSGLNIGTSNSATGINYQLYNGASAVGSPVAGATGAGINFGTFTATGTYSVMATNATTGCAIAMSGSATISINTLPATFAVTGGGNYCSGGSGMAIGLSGSVTGVAYQLYRGATAIGTATAGTGSSLSFGTFTSAGTYSVSAVTTATGCTSNMTGSATIGITLLPVVYTVTGGGNYCSGGAGLPVGLANSEPGISYQLYRSGTATGSPLTGTGSALSFGTMLAAGTYTVAATNTTTGCAANMSGSTAIGINPLPTVFTVAGGGSYCNGGLGVSVTLAGSNAGVNYQLYRGTAAVGTAVTGTGAMLDFGMQTAAGTYTVFATNATTTCTSNMAGSAAVNINPLPVSYNVIGGGNYCSGGSGVMIAIDGSAPGTSYQLYRGATAVGAPAAGTGAAIGFGLQAAAGTYTVLATNTATACTLAMAGSASVIVNATPSVFTVTGGGSYCSGGTGITVGLSGSAAGVNYQLFNGTTAVGTSVAGTGSAISFGAQSNAGTYTVTATSASSSCSAGMSGSASVFVNATPVVYTVTGGGNYCSGGTGVAIGLSGSAVGVNYQLYNGTAVAGTMMAGTGTALGFGMMPAGSYSVRATDAISGCSANMLGTSVVSTYALPTVYTVTGGGSFCAGNPGVSLGVSGSNTGISYQLYNGSIASGTPVLGNGSAISFGVRSVSGTYSVLATNTGSTCTSGMSGTAPVVVNALPVAHAIAGGGNYCAGGTGVSIGLASSSTGVNYQLYNGASTVGGAVAGTGSSISFGFQLAAGTYSVIATDAATLCTSSMTGTTAVAVNALPVAYTVTGGGNYCTGSAGLNISLSGSEAGVNYQLYRGATAVGTSIPGTGSSISFGTISVAGTYSVLAINGASACTGNMPGTATITVSPLPTVYTVSGGGAYCQGGSGVSVSLSGSDLGVDYRLYNGSTLVGTPIAGSGAGLDFGMQTGAGTYTVQAVNATTGCARNMTGSSLVSINPLPVAFTVTGGGNYCSGSTGITLGLAGSASGINYQLYSGTLAVGATLAGTGSPVSFGTQTAAGNYTVMAANAVTGCTTGMTGGATIGINTLPVVYTLSSGGNYCSGGAGVILSLDGSNTGISYQLFHGTTPAGSPVTGTGSSVSFGAQSNAGSYMVVATDIATGCSRSMSGTASVMMNTTPTAYTITGGGSYCTGGAGTAVGLAGSAIGVNYRLYSGSTAIGGPVAGTGADISFGLQTATGAYNVIGTDAVTGCSAVMSGGATISLSPVPAAFNVTGGGNYCFGGTGVGVGLNSSATGITYQLYVDGTLSGSPVSGTGGAITFGLKTPAGTYTAMATSTATGCTTTMTGSTTISINAAPVAYTITGGGNYCEGSAGAVIGLGGSDAGTVYQLYNGTASSGSSVAGTGSAISFGARSVTGTYTVMAMTSTTGCSNTMAGSVAVATTPLPAVFSVTGGGNYCAGTAGVHIGLSGSVAGNTYQLFNGTATVGAPVAGTGSSIDFGAYTTTGAYVIVATNAAGTCTRAMTGTAMVGLNALPTVYTVTGGGSYCTGSSGVNIGLGGSATGVSYQLYTGTTAVGTAVTGTGSALDFGLITGVGSYSVKATSTAGCVRTMAGLAVVNVNALPAAFTVTGGGNYCAGGTGAGISLSGSSVGVNYTLYSGGTAMSIATPGTGSAINFGLQSVVGTYTVTGTSAATGCVRTMTGSAAVGVTPTVLPVVSVGISTGDTVCAGTASVFSASGINGGSSPVYQWKVNGIPVGSGTTYSYIPANHDVVTAVLTSNATCALPATVTEAVTMAVNPTHVPAVAVSVTPDDTVCAGSTVTFTAAPSFGGTSPVYAWVKNGATVSSGTTYTYVPANGDIVYCRMTSNFTCRTVDNVSGEIFDMTVNVPPVPVVTISANPGTVIAKGESVTFTASTANGGPAPAYQWFVNGNVIGGATSTTFTRANLADEDSVSCRVTSSGPCGGLSSFNTVIMSVGTVGVGHTTASAMDVKVMPNPSKGEFTVKGFIGITADEEVSLEITNMLGQSIYSGKTLAKGGNVNERIVLDNTLANGMYMLNLRSATGSKVFYLVVEQ
ncbi:MAG: Ig-like domain-containing protein [Bacteroidota bacterium]